MKKDSLQQLGKETESELVSLCTNYINNETKFSKMYEDKYSFYQSSWGLADVLRETYPVDLDPGKIIGDYLKLFFAEVMPQPSTSSLQADKILIVHGSEIHKLLCDIGLTCIDASIPVGKRRECLKVALQSFLNPLDQIQITNEILFEDVLQAVIAAPKGFFESWASEWWLPCEKDQNFSPKISTATLKTLFQHATLQSDGCRETSGKHPVITINLINDLFFKIYEESSLEYDLELELLFADFHYCYSQIRKKNHYGVSPLNYLVASDLCKMLENEGYDISICDLTTILGTGFLFSGGTYLIPSGNGEVSPSVYEEKEVTYLVLFEKAHKDGFPELANALISLYLIARAFFCKCRFTPDSRLYTAISTGLSLPGARVLQKTLEILVSWVGEYLTSEPAAILSGRFFKQFLPQQAMLHLLHGKGNEAIKRPSEDADVEAFLVSQLGLERWVKLCNESKNQLKTAETLWRKGFAEFGFGITDCSGLIANYNKVIEKELVDRLETFYFSTQFQSFFEEKAKKKPDKKPSIGILVRELLDYQNLPSNLRKLMDDSRLTVHHDRDLVKELQKIGTFRNQAAHKDEFNIVMYSKFKKIYFQDRLIHRFIDCLH